MGAAGLFQTWLLFYLLMFLQRPADRQNGDEIETSFQGKKRIVKPAPAGGVVEPVEKKGYLKLLSGIQQLVRILGRVSTQVGNAALKMPFTIAEISTTRRWDGVFAAAIGEGRFGSLLDILNQQMLILTGNRVKPDETIVPNLNKLMGLFTAT